MISTLSDALAERGYETLTAVQEAVTAPELENADLLVSAQTGSGKTVGFGLAIAKTLMGEEARLGAAAAPLALVVAPTRELALQVQRELAWLYGKAGARVVSCIGGMDAREERRALDRGAHIVVGTPGRLRDHITRGSLDLTDIRAVVLDEADEMLDLGFREDLEFMLGEAPEDRRTLMFSATVPRTIAEMAKQFQRDAVRVTTLTGGSQHADIAYQLVQVAPRDAENAIINLLRFHDSQTAIVFANTRAAVAHLTARFANRGMSVVSLSGELSQDERSHALQALRDGRARVCVATDVAARGIDLPNLDLVIHADLPTNTEALLHRSGRTGRAGRKGISALIVPDKATNKASRLLKWAKIEGEWVTAPTPDEILSKDEARLLEDPAWGADLTESEAAFAATLLAQHSPEQVAAACLRLYRAKLSAPEEVATGTSTPPRDPRASFGPSAWVSLSIGRDKGAEPRWLLPLLCRAGGLDKGQIGKIRVQDTATFVELQAPAVADFLAQLGPGGLLEEDVRATVLDNAPDIAARPRPQGDRPRGDKPRFDKPRDDKPRAAKPRDDRPRGDRPHSDRPRADKPGWGKPTDERPRADRPRSDKPRDDRPRADKPRSDKPKWDKPRKDGPRPDRKSTDTPARKPAKAKPDAAAPAKPAEKPRAKANPALSASQSLRSKDGARKPRQKTAGYDSPKRGPKPGGKGKPGKPRS
ncbi:DEAD/DEAH box helicase [Nioella nitratireducens]|uniref:DEAD/DEAH box helicase n=1 Tax=Nioella nitratireducens TaxID=1287720 RepID=UPI0008FD8CA7|nr:DEAD/DEAH box helicase [Nioella nitratireducens]